MVGRSNNNVRVCMTIEQKRRRTTRLFYSRNMISVYIETIPAVANRRR